MKLTDFLTARLDDDENQVAVPGFVQAEFAQGRDWGNRGRCPLCDARQDDGTEAITQDAWHSHAERVHQRSRVLADVKAKRRIMLALDAIAGPGQTYRGRLQLTSENAMNVIAHDAMRDLVLPYARHPDYDEAWRP